MKEQKFTMEDARLTIEKQDSIGCIQVAPEDLDRLCGHHISDGTEYFEKAHGE